jgi:acetamidase/formamidase
MIRSILMLSLISLASVSAAEKNTKFDVNLYQPVVLNGTAFKAGDAKVEIIDGNAVIKQGKLTAQAPVKVELAKEKFLQTRVGYKDSQLNDISVGGSNKHILFQGAVGGQ